VRSGGSPLPRPPVRSFLATAVNPSPNFGGGVQGSPRCASAGAARRRPVIPRPGPTASEPTRMTAGARNLLDAGRRPGRGSGTDACRRRVRRGRPSGSRTFGGRRVTSPPRSLRGRGRERGAPALMRKPAESGAVPREECAPAGPLATVVSLPTARAARPGAQRRGTPKTAVRKCGVRERGSACNPPLPIRWKPTHDAPKTPVAKRFPRRLRTEHWRRGCVGMYR
jgi:hypothetical protein